MELKRQLGLATATLTVIASMIGTGIFFTTGIVLGMTHNALTVLTLWGLGCMAALCGALCYVEFAAMWPYTGGEYVYLKMLFGRLPAFLTGWISLVVGFSAPAATGALAFVSYLNAYYRDYLVSMGRNPVDLLSGDWAQRGTAAAVVVLLSVLHMIGVQAGSRIQNALTVLKLTIVVTFILGGLALADWGHVSRLTASYEWTPPAAAGGLPTTALALLIITFSYTGWNAASYIAGEVKDPEKNLPKALLRGTLVTGVLYMMLNVVYLLASPGEALMGQEAIGAVTAGSLFPPAVVRFYTLGIALILLSSISVQMMIGPRVYFAMAQDRLMFQPLARVSPRFRTPVLSIALQMALTILYVLTGSAQTLLEYMGFALTIFPLLVVAGLIWQRKKQPHLQRPYRMRFYPWAPLLYIFLMASTALAGLMAWTRTTWFALGVTLLGIPIYYLWERLGGKEK